MSNITIRDLFEMFLVTNSIIAIKSAILRLPILDTKDLCLPNQFSKASWQKLSVSTDLTGCQRRNWVASMIGLTLIFNPSYVWHDMNNIWPASFVKLPWRCRTNFIQSWKDLRKTLRSHENLQSLTDLSGANINIYSNSSDWLFWMSMMSKINLLMNKTVLR